MEKVETLSIEEVANSLNVGPQAIRVGLQRNKFPFGVALPPKEGYKRWNYIIFKKRFLKYIEGDDLNGKKDEQKNEE